MEKQTPLAEIQTRAQLVADFEKNAAELRALAPDFAGRYLVALVPLDGSQVCHLENFRGVIEWTPVTKAQTYSTQERAARRVADFAGQAVPEGYRLEVLAAEAHIADAVARIEALVGQYK